MGRINFSRALSKYNNMSTPVKAGLWFTVCSIVQRGISVLSMPVFTRLLSPSQFGEYSLFLSWETLISLVVTLNIFSEVFNKGLVEHSEERDDYIVNQIGQLTCQVLVATVLLIVFRDYLCLATGFSFALLAVMLAGIYFNGVISFWFARKRFEYDYKKIIAVTVSISVLSVLLGIVFVLASEASMKVFARVFAGYCPVFVIGLFIFISTMKKSKKVFSSSWWKATWILCLPLLPHYLSQVALNQTDKIMIGWFDSAASVAIYGIAHSAGLLLVLVNNGIISSLVPWLYGRLKSREYESIPAVSSALTAIVVLCNAVLIFLAPEAVLLLSTIDYLDAIWCIAPIATSVVFTFCYTLFVNVEIYYGKTGYVAFASIVAALVNVCLNLICIPVFGYVAAAYTTAFSYFCMMVFHRFALQKTLKQSEITQNIFSFKQLYLCCLAVIVVAALAMLLYSLAIARYVVLFVVFALCLANRRKIVGVISAIR